MAAARRRAAPVVEPLEGRRLLASDFGMMGLLGSGVEASHVAGPNEDARAPRGAAVEAADERPSVTSTRPANGATDQPRSLFVAADVLIPNVGHGVDAETLTSSTVKLVRAKDNVQVAANVNTSGGGDAIVLTPTGLLDANTQYKFVVSSGVTDTAGTAFRSYSSTFTTGSYVGNTLDPSVQFSRAEQPAAVGHQYTGLTLGPDGRLYAGTLDGKILRFDVGATGTLSAPLVIHSINANNGGSAALATRTVTGVRFDPASTATNLILWVSHGELAEENATNWTGKVSRLTGATLGTYKDYVTGLPRSVRDHLNNQIDFGPDGALYLSQGSNTSMGAPDTAWGMRPETLLTGAVLRVDVSKITNAVNVKTEAGGTYDPYAAGAPVTLYATGVRNGFDLVWHSNGGLYVPTNGGAAGGNTPAFTDDDADEPAPRRIDGTYDGTVVPGLENVAETQADYLFRVRKGGYYGHPNPTRGEYVLNGGNPTTGLDAGEVPSYPVGTRPDANYRGFEWRFGRSFSPDGIIEYRGDAFGGVLKGRLLVTRYSGGDDVAILEVAPDGTIVRADTGIPGLMSFNDPLDLVEDRRNGNLYVVEHGAGKITLAKPVPVGADPSPEEPPTITAAPADQTIPEGRAVTFSVKAEGNGLRYRWQRDGVDIPGATGASYALNAVKPADTGALFQVVVSNGAGSVTSRAVMLTVTPSRPPVATITTPAAGTTYAGGQSFTFAGTAVDPDEGELTGAAYTWEVTRHRGDDVRPFVTPFTGDKSGSFQVPVDGETAADVFYRIKLVVRDSGGLLGEAIRDVTPRTVDLTLASSLQGVSLTLDGTAVGPNLTFPSVVGVVRTLGAPATYVLDGADHEFESWSDGVTTPTRTVSTPDVATSYTANYKASVVTPPPAPPAPPPPNPPNNPGPPVPGPDLAIDTAAVARAGAGGRATVRVANRGLVPFNAPATLELFLSPDATADADDTAVATVARKLKLKSGAAKPLKVKFLQPQVPADGDYFLVARVVPADATGEAGNDVGASAATVAFRKPVIDFTGSMATPAPASVIRGGKVTAALTLTNAGSVPANGPLAMTVFAIPQGADPATGPRTELATLTQTVKVNPAVGRRVKLNFVVPNTLAPGTYTIGVQLDAAGAFNESDETNNTVVGLTPLTVF